MVVLAGTSSVQACSLRACVASIGANAHALHDSYAVRAAVRRDREPRFDMYGQNPYNQLII